jgi:hypothetical protein
MEKTTFGTRSLGQDAPINSAKLFSLLENPTGFGLKGKTVRLDLKSAQRRADKPGRHALEVVV